MFLCPTCKERFIKDLSKVANIQKANHIKGKCQCGHVFRAMIERRQNLRKSVELVGACLYSAENGHAKRQLIKIHGRPSSFDQQLAQFQSWGFCPYQFQIGR